MEKIRIKKTDLDVSRLCIGGCPLGEHGWGDFSHNELIRSVAKAYDEGVNFFDTADTYGLGRSESNLADALGKKINKAIIATKFGVRVENGRTFYDNTPEYIEKAIDKSLERLKRDCVDLYIIHHRDNTPLTVVKETLDKLKKQGKIRYYGLSNIFSENEEELKLVGKDFVCLQDEFSLARRQNEKSLNKLCGEFDLTPLTWGSLGQGILTGEFDENCKFDANDRRSRAVYVNFHGEKLKKNMKIVSVMREISKEKGKSVSSIAIRFILDYLKGSVALVGVKTERHVESNMEAVGWKLTDEEIKRLDEISREADN